MPRYDYKCSACGAQYEKREGFDAPSVQACPTCNGEARRVLTPPAIVFKGSGWYVTDSRKGAPSSDGAGSSSEKSDTSTTSETKSETKSTAPAAAPSGSAASGSGTASGSSASSTASSSSGSGS